MPDSAQAEILQEHQQAVPQFLLPAFMLSLFLHTAVLVAVLYTFWNLPPRGASDATEFREVGLYPKKSDKPAAVPNNDDSETEATEAVSSSAQPEETEADLTVSQPPSVALELPAPSQLGVAPAVPTPGTNPLETRNPLTFSGAGTRGTPVGELAANQPGTPFFGVAATGTRFVYVIDSSGSMSNHNAIGVARSELMASLQNLDRTKQFQIIFYNTKTKMMPHKDGDKILFWGTEINRTLARQFISSIQPDSGTDHLPALKLALGLNPEVIFLLTDAEEPQLTAADLNEIKQRNQGRTQIHAIEFGKGAALATDNFLKKLSRQNNGSYRYFDVTQFSRSSPKIN